MKKFLIITIIVVALLSVAGVWLMGPSVFNLIVGSKELNHSSYTYDGYQLARVFGYGGQFIASAVISYVISFVVLLALALLGRKFVKKTSK